MSVKGVCLVNSVRPGSSDSTKLRAVIVYCGLDATSPVDQSFIEIDNIDPGIVAVSLEAAIENAVKNKLINDHGYSFGIFDSVRLIGGLI